MKSALRALEILELLTRSERPMAFTEIVSELGYPRSSIHGLLRTLADKSWVDYDESSRNYALGIRALEAGNAYSRSLGLVERSKPVMKRIRDTLDETVQLAVLDGTQCVYVAKYDGGQALALVSEVGRRLPAYTTGVGKVLLAGLPEAELQRRLADLDIVRFTSHTIGSREELLRQLTRIRQCGFGMDNEEYTIGVRCVAVPIADHQRRWVAAMSVSVPTIRFSPRQREKTHALLKEAASEISAALGFPAAAGFDRQRKGTESGNVHR